jgi:hypothetical protein
MFQTAALQIASVQFTGVRCATADRLQAPTRLES